MWFVEDIFFGISSAVNLFLNGDACQWKNQGGGPQRKLQKSLQAFPTTFILDSAWD
jgi:hypothetical protein